MLKKLILLAILALSLTQTATAAFSIEVTSPGNAGVGAFSYNSGPLGAGNFLFGPVDIAPGPTRLFLDYDLTNNPTGSFFQINGLNFQYSTNANDLPFTVTIRETAATFPGAVGVTGMTNFGSYGNATASFDSTTTFTGTGANTISFPTLPFVPFPGINYTGTTNFMSTGNSGLIEIVFNVNLPQSTNASFGATGLGTGIVGLEPEVVPVPATALLGLFAVPAMAIIRRRRGK